MLCLLKTLKLYKAIYNRSPPPQCSIVKNKGKLYLSHLLIYCSIKFFFHLQLWQSICLWPGSCGWPSVYSDRLWSDNVCVVGLAAYWNSWENAHRHSNKKGFFFASQIGLHILSWAVKIKKHSIFMWPEHAECLCLEIFLIQFGPVQPYQQTSYWLLLLVTLIS